MEATAQVPSPGPAIVNSSANTPSRPLEDLGPNLMPLGRLKRYKVIAGYIIQHHGGQIAFLVSAMVVLFALTHAWDEILPPAQILNGTGVHIANPSNWAEAFGRAQSYISVGTLIVALLVWYGKLLDEWENSLPKRMSVFFFKDGRPAIVCRYVWLAGAEDLRAWGQQVAAQSVSSQSGKIERLEFSPDVESLPASLEVMPDGKVFKHHPVFFKLINMPSVIRDSGMCLYQNMASSDKSVRHVSSEQREAMGISMDWQITNES